MTRKALRLENRVKLTLVCEVALSCTHVAHGHPLSGRRERETLRARKRERERLSPGAGTRDVNVSVFVCVRRSGGGGWGFLWVC